MASERSSNSRCFCSVTCVMQLSLTVPRGFMQRVVVGEVTQSYLLAFDTAPHHIRSLLPHAKLIVLLADPAEAAYNLYRCEKQGVSATDTRGRKRSRTRHDDLFLSYTRQLSSSPNWPSGRNWNCCPFQDVWDQVRSPVDSHLFAGSPLIPVYIHRRTSLSVFSSQRCGASGHELISLSLRVFARAR